MLNAVDDTNFSTEVLESDVPVLVDFWAEWCAPCKAMDPLLEQAADEFDGRVKLVKLNAADNPSTVSQFGVRNMPTYLIFDKGEVVDMKVGATLSKVGLTKWLEGVSA
ncbi:thioredoxin [Maritalea mobilis]|uniref:Thioredoxin n=2 Tax=Maritalea mobilis TaxID=483324 RepID=A0A4R6VKD2_9HYPH|nr:thioredoxin [Maritalea mobilis]TDQ62106.1 thioredoxin [Maritalea mobilis]